MRSLLPHIKNDVFALMAPRLGSSCFAQMTLLYSLLNLTNQNGIRPMIYIGKQISLWRAPFTIVRVVILRRFSTGN